MQQWNVLVTRKLPQPGMDRLRSQCRLEVNEEDRVLARSELMDGLAGKDGLCCLLTDAIDAEVIQACPTLRVIANYAVGYNNIDVEAATRRGVMVTNTPGVLTETTADLTWSLILAVARRVVEGDTMTRRGRFRGWAPELLLGGDVHGKALGIVGAGRIGTAVARRSRGFGMTVCYFDQQASPVLEKELGARRLPLRRLLEESDVVSLHVPLSQDTYHLIGSRELGWMKSTAYLINTSRGPVIDEVALVDALDRRQIGGTGLDVYEQEPKLSPGLADMPNAVLLPHLGSATRETRARMAMMVAENCLAGLKGNVPPNLVNPAVLADTGESRGT